MIGDKKARVWVIAFFLFIFIRLTFFNLVSLETGALIPFYCIGVAWFIEPYILGDDINVPGYSHMLKKGSDDILRLLMLLAGVLLCLATAFSKVDFFK